MRFLNGNEQIVDESSPVTVACTCESSIKTEIKLNFNDVEINQDNLTVVIKNNFIQKVSYKINSFNVSEHNGTYECYSTIDERNKEAFTLIGYIKDGTKRKNLFTKFYN